MKESDLYLPLKHFLTSQNYEVKGETRDGSVLAVRAAEPPIVVELKLSLNLNVILQAVEQLSITSSVYIGVPNRCSSLERKRKKIIKLLRMLGLGLVVINPEKEGHVEVLLDPGEYKPRKSERRKSERRKVCLLGEFSRRIDDPKVGATEKRKDIITPYRQKALLIAQFLRGQGPTKAVFIAQSIQEPRARDILYKDVYGWFERESQGIYSLSPQGEKEVLSWEKKLDQGFEE